MDYRQLLEVLKFSSVVDVLSQLTLVSSQWANPAASKELWDSLLETYCFSSRDSHERNESGLRAFRRRVFFTKKVSYFYHSELHLVDFRKNAHKVEQISWPNRPYIGYFCVLLPSNEVIVTGGTCISGGGYGCYQPHYLTDEVALVSERDVSILCRLSVARTHHSAICYRDSLYIFGGLSNAHLSDDEDGQSQIGMYNAVELAQPIALRERMNLHNKGGWERLPDMLEPRIDFTVCVYSQVIYLGSFNGAAKANSVETFNPGTGVSAYLKVRLPETPVLFTAVVEGELLLLRRDGYTAVSLDSNEVTDNPWNYYDEWSKQSGGKANSNLVVMGKCLYEVSEEHMFMFDLEKKTRRAWTPHEPTKNTKRKSF